jgi:hypothetical protein
LLFVFIDLGWSIIWLLQFSAIPVSEAQFLNSEFEFNKKRFSRKKVFVQRPSGSASAATMNATFVVSSKNLGAVLERPIG